MSAPAPAPAVWKPLALVETTAAYFASKGIGTPRLDAELLLCHVLGGTRLELYTCFDRPVSGEKLDRYRALVRRRAAREPVAYLLGEKEFHSRAYRVGPGVFIPRPETELLVDTASEWLRLRAGRAARILDLGTGSGCIAVSLAALHPGLQATAIDRSATALYLAGENARRHKVTERVAFWEGDLYEPLRAGGRETPLPRFDLILSNPPYIAENDPSVQEEVRLHEPPEALYAGSDGLAFYRRLAEGLDDFLAPGGMALFELGAGQAIAAGEIFVEAGFLHLLLLPDLAGVERVLCVARAAESLPAATANAGAAAERVCEPVTESCVLLEEEAVYQPLPAEAACNEEPSPGELDRLLDAYGEDNEDEFEEEPER